MRIRTFAMLGCSLLMVPGIGVAEQSVVCSGWLPAVNTHGVVGAESPLHIQECPPGEVLLSERTPAGHPATPRKLAVTGACCPYPPDALTSETVRAAVQCPANHVVTGAIHPGNGEADLLCRKINTARYRLGPARPAVLITERGGEEGAWNSFLQLFDRGYTGSARAWTALPPALRYGLARVATDRWDFEFCTGYPWGSALTGKTLGRGCSFEHRELLRADGTAEKVFPDCLAIGSLLRAYPECIQALSDTAP